jgi:hypothetical protein
MKNSLPVVHLTAVDKNILWIADLLTPPVDGHLVLAIDGDSSHAANEARRTVDTSACVKKIPRDRYRYYGN